MSSILSFVLSTLIALSIAAPCSTAIAAGSASNEHLEPGWFEGRVVPKMMRVIPTRSPSVDHETFERWGFLANLAGKRFVLRKPHYYDMSVKWRKEGEVLEFKAHLENRQPSTSFSAVIRYDAKRQRLFVEGSNRLGYRQADGTYYFAEPGLFTISGIQFIPAADGFFMVVLNYAAHFKMDQSAVLASTSPANMIDVQDVNTSAQLTGTPAVPQSWGWIDSFIGKTLMYRSHDIVLETEEDGEVLNIGSFRVRRTSDPNVLQVMAFPRSCSEATASIRDDAAIVIECEEWDFRKRWIYSGSGEAIAVEAHTLSRAGLNFTNSWQLWDNYKFEPATEERRVAEQARQRYEDERHRIRIAEEAEERRESQQRMAQQFGQMLGDLSAHANKEMQNNANQAAFLARLNTEAQAAQARKEAQVRREQADRNQERARAQQYATEQARQYEALAAASARAISVASPPTGTRTGGDQALVGDDPRTCVSPPAAGRNPNCKDGNSASITNGCSETVEARICIFTSKGKWDCGVSYGINPGSSWSYPSCFGTDRFFFDVRRKGSAHRFAEPH